MSQSDPPNRFARKITGIEIVCVALVPVVWSYLVNEILKSAHFFAWFYGEEAPDSAPLVQLRRGLWITSIAAPFQILSALIFLRSGIGVSLDAIGITTRNLGRQILGGLVFAVIFVPGTYGIQALALLALEAAGSKPQEHPFTQLGTTGLLPVEWGLLLFGAVVLAPTWEELVFRGLVQPWVMRHGQRGGLVVLTLAALLAAQAVAAAWVPSPGVGEMAVKLAPLWILALLVGAFFLIDRRNTAWGGLFASAVLFAWIHVSVWPSPVPLVWLALGLGWLAWRGRSLAGAVVLHAVFNAVACAALFYGPKDASIIEVPAARHGEYDKVTAHPRPGPKGPG
jgi:membrane protease YdiL (CAAX protease family)